MTSGQGCHQLVHVSRRPGAIPKVLPRQGQALLCSSSESYSSADIKKCKLAVHQSFDAIQAAADWLNRDSKDVEQVRGGCCTRYKAYE
jgi:hypothetical protein